MTITDRLAFTSPYTAVEMEEQRTKAGLYLVRKCELRAKLATETFRQALVDPVSQWYTDPTWLFVPTLRVPALVWQEMDADDRRAIALGWLRLHIDGIKEIARRMGIERPTLEKVANEYQYGVQLTVHHWVDHEVTAALAALVPADTTCVMVPTGEFETIPEQRVERMEKQCPPSIYAGVVDDLVPDAPVAPAEEPF